MALGLDGNWRAELLRLRLARKIGDDGVKFLIEPPGDSRDATLSLANEALNGTDLDRLYRATDNIATRKREASNEWVLSGAHSVSGKPLLANDPHLGARLPRHLVSRAPGRAGLRHPRRHLARLAGRRARPQRHDRLGLHHHQPRQPGPVHRAGRSDRSQPLHHARRRAAVRRARGDDQRRCGAIRCTMRVRETRHGPVIDDFIAPRRRSHAAGPRAGAAGHRARRRRHLGRGLRPHRPGAELGGFPAAPRARSSRPMQNMVYADTAGNIGLVSPARVPIRRKGDGSMPVPGWTSEFDWAGFVPFDELPRVYNPAERHHRQRQRPPGARRLPPLHQPRLGRALPPAPRQPAPARGRAPSGLRHDRHAGRQPHARRRRDAAAAAEGRAAQRRAPPGCTS